MARVHARPHQADAPLSPAMAVSDRHEQLLRRAYVAFNARDVDGALKMMHADVDWPNGMEGGRVHGKEAVREYWERQFGLIDSHVEPRRIEHRPDGQVVVTVHQLVRDPAGKVISDETVEHHYLIAAGLIKSMEIQS
jgi:ketosteroid isomerase-like protein